MAILKKQKLIKKKKGQLKKGKIAIQNVKQEENEEEGDHGFKKDKAEFKGLDLDVKEESDEIYDSDECFLKDKLANLQKKAKDIKAKLEKKKEETKRVEEERKKSSNQKKKRENKRILGKEALKKAPKEDIESKENTSESQEDIDARTLYLGKLPDDVTTTDIKGLSQDIIKVYFSKIDESIRFAFITFKDTATAESNYSVLQKSKIRGQTFDVDYCVNKSLCHDNTKKAEIKERDSRTLYVGNLPDSVTEEELKRLSKDIAEVYISQSKNKFALLLFHSKQKAKSNVEALNGKEIKGQPIIVCLKENSPLPIKEESHARSLFIENVPNGVNKQELKDLSRDIIKVALNKKDGSRFRSAFITFKDESTAEYNYSLLQKSNIRGLTLNVDYTGKKSNAMKERDVRKLFVKNLPDGVTEKELKQLSNDIVEVYISKGEFKFAYLLFDSHEKAKSNVEALNGKKIKGQPIIVRLKVWSNLPAFDCTTKAVKRSQESDLCGTQKSAKKIKR